MSPKNSPTLPMISSLLTAIAASLCCVGPFVLVSLGVSGSWISSLSKFDSYRPFFILFTLLMLLYAGWMLYRPIENCLEGSICSIPRLRKNYRILYWVIATCTIILITSPYWLSMVLT